MTPRRGELWAVEGRAARTVLVVSGNMFNDLPDHPFVLAMQVVAAVSTSPAVIDIGGGDFAVVDTIGRVPKRLCVSHLRTAGMQELADVDNLLFKILATN